MIQLRGLPTWNCFIEKPMFFQYLEIQDSDSGYQSTLWLREWLCFLNSSPEGPRRVCARAGGAPSGIKDRIILTILHSTLGLIRRPRSGPSWGSFALKCFFSGFPDFSLESDNLQNDLIFPICFTPQGWREQYKVWLLSPRKGPVLLSCVYLMSYCKVFFFLFLFLAS